MSAPNIKEIEWAISELENQESSEGRYTLLAALYTCRNHMLGNTQPEPRIAAYSAQAAPEGRTVGRYGESEFLQAVSGKDSGEVWAVMNELMDTLHVVNSRVYDSVMRKLSII